MKLETNRHASPIAAASGLWKCAFLALAVTVGTQVAHAQATATATQNLGFSVFGAYSRTNPDYGASGSGFAFGGEVKRHFRLVDPALELRYGHVSKDVTENTLTGDVKLEKTLGPGHRFTPYLDAGLGYGSFTAPADKDSAIFKNIGGGVDVGVTSHVAIKVDYQYQFWAFGGPGDFTLTPSVFSIGAVYKFNTLPFRRH